MLRHFKSWDYKQKDTKYRDLSWFLAKLTNQILFLGDLTWRQPSNMTSWWKNLNYLPTLCELKSNKASFSFWLAAASLMNLMMMSDCNVHSKHQQQSTSIHRSSESLEKKLKIDFFHHLETF